MPNTNETQAGPQDDPKAGEQQVEPGGGETVGGAAADGQDGGDDVKDTHGQPGINKERHDKEMAAKDEEIAKLQAQISELSKTEEGRKKLTEDIDKLKAEIADERVTHKLEMAGCRNVKAAKALLGDYEGDVAKLKDECPYLFGADKRTGSTGLKPEGSSTDLDDKLDKAFKLK